jgi:catechol 2,3-dioxygenase-like lactoylglutathione lyase family enzyme
MLKDADAIATIAVRNLDRARKFYEGTLGFSAAEDEGDAIRYRSGSTSLLVYQSHYAGTNQATAATWVVPDAEAIVAALREKEARFEHYDLPGLTRKGDLLQRGVAEGSGREHPSHPERVRRRRTARAYASDVRQSRNQAPTSFR